MPKTDLITIRIGGTDYLKPHDPSCRACRSPWMLQIDHWLAAGYPVKLIAERLRARGDRVPQASLTAHVAHLAPPHQADREEAARLGEPGAPAESLGTVTASVIRRSLEALVAGAESMELTPRDLLRAVRLQLEIEKAEAESQRGTADEWQAAFTEFFELARRHLPPASFGMFMRDVYASEAITAVTGRQVTPLLAATAQGPEPVGEETASTRDAR